MFFLHVQVMYCDEEKKFNIDIITGLIRSEILNLGDYDVHLAKMVDSGRNSMLKYIFLYFNLRHIICYFVILDFHHQVFMCSPCPPPSSKSSEGATEFAISLVQTLITQEPNGVSKLYNVVDVLSKVGRLSKWFCAVESPCICLIRKW
jgi:CCR4-NOT transcription complex subunit 1